MWAGISKIKKSKTFQPVVYCLLDKDQGDNISGSSSLATLESVIHTQPNLTKGCSEDNIGRNNHAHCSEEANMAEFLGNKDMDSILFFRPSHKHAEANRFDLYIFYYRDLPPVFHRIQGGIHWRGKKQVLFYPEIQQSYYIMCLPTRPWDNLFKLLT